MTANIDLAGWLTDNADGTKTLRLSRPFTRTVRDGRGQREEEIESLTLREPLAEDLDYLGDGMREARVFAARLTGFSVQTLGKSLPAADGLRLIVAAMSMVDPTVTGSVVGASPEPWTTASETLSAITTGRRRSSAG